jgi:hypothetical protein
MRLVPAKDAFRYEEMCDEKITVVGTHPQNFD